MATLPLRLPRRYGVIISVQNEKAGLCLHLSAPEDEMYGCLILITRIITATWARWLRWSRTPIGSGSIPQSGHVREAADGCFSLISKFLSLSLPTPFSKINKHTLGCGLKKKRNNYHELSEYYIPDTLYALLLILKNNSEKW